MPCIRFRFQSGRYYDWEFERGGIELAVEVNGPLTLGDQGLILEAALDGAGIAYTFEAQVEELIAAGRLVRSEEHTSELQSLMRISYAVFCLKKKNHPTH